MLRQFVLFLLALPAAAQFNQVFSRLDAFIEREMRDKQIAGMSVAIVDDQKTVWSRDFGVPAGAVHRVGSVSKLFTDIAALQLVERGELDLDAPVTRYLPDFHPRNPYGKAITLRQLMSHRSGLVREPPVGHYFDPSGPTLEATVRSLNDTALVYEPETRTKYSNAAIAVVGYMLQRQTREPFARRVEEKVLAPLGMTHSGFELTAPLRQTLAKAFMWTYDGRTFEAPGFAFGMAPAGNLYSTASDMGHFLAWLNRRGGGILKTETLEGMWQPQYTGNDFGVGFHLRRMDGKRVVGHGGAVYGFATSVEAMPDERLGVVAIATKDSANAVVERITTQALRWMLAARKGAALEDAPSTDPLPPGTARKLAGCYGEGEKGIELIARDDRLFVLPFRGGQRVELRKRNGVMVTDDTLDVGREVRIQAPRRDPPKPAPLKRGLAGLIGEYGWDHDVLYILERQGSLTALIEWYDYYPLKQVGRRLFQFPDWGLYAGETLEFTAKGALLAGGVLFERRAAGPESGGVFRIAPREPVEELRRKALAAQPPVESGDLRQPDLVELTSLDPAIKLDIRYAGSDNFLSAPMYTQARAFMQRPAAEAVVRAHRKLAALGYGLLIHDAYRPWYVTRMFWDGTPEDKHNFVADPAKGSRHNRGCAVDLTMYDRATGKPVEMVGVYDEMSPRSYPDYPGGTALQRWQRELLRRTMEDQGFAVYEFEWWHFDYKDWAKYGVQNVRFEKMGRPR